MILTNNVHHLPVLTFGETIALQFIRAKKAVVSNASMWDTLKLLPRDVLPKSYVDGVNMTPQCESFMHLHLGFDAEVSIHTNRLSVKFPLDYATERNYVWTMKYQSGNK